MTGTGSAMKRTPTMAHNDPTILPAVVTGFKSPYPTCVNSFALRSLKLTQV